MSEIAILSYEVRLMLKMAGNGVRRNEGNKPVKLVVLGLSHMNLSRLRAGQPIIFRGEDVDQPGVEFIIFSGETEHSMAMEMQELVGPYTRVKLDPRTTN